MAPRISSAERFGIEKGRQEALETMEPRISSAERFGIEKGLKEGIERGRQEGIERGREALRDLILETLEDRFGNVPYWVSEQLRTVEDTDHLKSLQRLAMKCSQFEDFSIAEAP